MVRHLLFQNYVCTAFLVNNKQIQFLRLLNKIKINMLSHLFENKIHLPISLDKNIYDFVVEVIFVSSQF